MIWSDNLAYKKNLIFTYDPKIYWANTHNVSAKTCNASRKPMTYSFYRNETRCPTVFILVGKPHLQPVSIFIPVKIFLIPCNLSKNMLNIPIIYSNSVLKVKIHSTWTSINLRRASTLIEQFVCHYISGS